MRRRKCGPPGRAHPRTIPMVPAGPHRSGAAIDEGDPDRGPSPVQHHSGGSPLRLLPMDSWPYRQRGSGSWHTHAQPYLMMGHVVERTASGRRCCAV